MSCFFCKIEHTFYFSFTKGICSVKIGVNYYFNSRREGTRSKRVLDWRSMIVQHTERTIFHIDVNSAFLSWDAAYRLYHLGGTLDLRTIPSAVGGDIELRHGIILAKSIPSKKYGIQTGESIMEAKKKCPNLVIVPPNYGLYEKCSRAFMKILAKYSDSVEQYSIDEAFLDVTGTQTLFGTPVELAHRIKDEIKFTLGFTVNVGIGPNKLLAKMASDFKKPDRVHTLYFHEIEKKMWPLPVRDLFFCGHATERKLHSLGIVTIGEIANTDLAFLRSHLKKQGEVMWNFAHGFDASSVVKTSVPNKGYGNSTTIPFDVTNRADAKKVLLSLAETVGRRLRRDNKRVKTVSIGIRFYDLSYLCHQGGLPSATNVTEEIWKEACRLFDEIWDGLPIRHLGIHTSKVSSMEEGRQLSIFDPNYERTEKLEKVDQAIDDIRKRYGSDAVFRATFAKQNKVDHLSGGISREKKSVDYSKIEVI